MEVSDSDIVGGGDLDGLAVDQAIFGRHGLGELSGLSAILVSS